MFRNAILFRVNLAQKFYSFCKKFENDESVYIFDEGPFLHVEVNCPSAEKCTKMSKRNAPPVWDILRYFPIGIFNPDLNKKDQSF